MNLSTRSEVANQGCSKQENAGPSSAACVWHCPTRKSVLVAGSRQSYILRALEITVGDAEVSSTRAGGGGSEGNANSTVRPCRQRTGAGIGLSKGTGCGDGS